MATNLNLTSQICRITRLRRPLYVAIFALALAVVAPKGARAEGSPIGDTKAVESKARPVLVKSQIKELAGRLILDAYSEVTQGLQADKYLDFISISTPSFPALGHARVFSNSAGNQIIAAYSNGTTQVLGSSGSGSGTITGVTAGTGLTGGGTSGTVTLSLGTPIDNANIDGSSVTKQGNLISLAALSASTITLSVSTSSLQTQVNSHTVSINNLSTSTGTIYTLASGKVNYSSFSAVSPITFNSVTGSIGATPISLSTSITGILPVANGGTATATPGLIAGLNITSITGTWPNQTINAAASGTGDVVAASTQTFTGGNTFVSSVTLKGQTLIKGTTTNDSAPVGYVGEAFTSGTTGLVAFPTTNTYGDYASLMLGAGDWDVSLLLGANPGSAVITRLECGVTTSSGISGTGLNEGDNSIIDTSVVGRAQFCVIPTYRMTFTTPTVVYLKFLAVYTVATPNAVGRISARRVR